MSYTNDQTFTLVFPSANIGGAGMTALQFQGPKGMTGRILDFGVRPVSVAFTATTTQARLQIGTVGTANAYADLPLGTAGIGTEVRESQVPGNQITNAIIPADTIATITGVAATGGSPAGTGVPYIDILWY